MGLGLCRVFDCELIVGVYYLLTDFPVGYTTNGVLSFLIIWILWNTIGKWEVSYT